MAGRFTSPKATPYLSGRRDSNPQPPPWQGGALPIELLPQIHEAFSHPAGFEPAFWGFQKRKCWGPHVLPLHYKRNTYFTSTQYTYSTYLLIFLLNHHSPLLSLKIPYHALPVIWFLKPLRLIYLDLLIVRHDDLSIDFQYTFRYTFQEPQMGFEPTTY